MPYTPFETEHKLFSGTQKVAINVDCMDDIELQQLRSHPATHPDVSRYAELITLARSHRLSGNIDKAMRLEDKAEHIYRILPSHLRW